MTEENQNNDTKVEKEEESINASKSEEAISKSKFTFKCTQCDECCLARGPIPITIWDFELWAKNGVIANFLPYLDIYSKPDGGLDLILNPILSKKSDKSQENPPKDPFADIPIEQLLEEKCPMYNKDQKNAKIVINKTVIKNKFL